MGFDVTQSYVLRAADNSLDDGRNQLESCYAQEVKVPSLPMFSFDKLTSLSTESHIPSRTSLPVIHEHFCIWQPSDLTCPVC